ncbi:MAG: hypothetical protein IKB34_00560 [Clostridia bacterium]|nr:hypothetical protein [Clostridia bacterium]
MKKFIYRVERAVSRIAVENLMTVIIGAMGIFYIATLLYPELYSLLYFDRALILQGQVWRLLTFLFLYDGGNIFYFLLFAYFYWWMGSSLEGYWGKTRFCTYYYIGILTVILSGFIAGYTTATYLNLSLFFAFAMLDPNHELLIFFILPVKIKWLAWLDAAYFIFMFFISGWAGKAAIVAAFLNFLIFFYDDFYRRMKLFVMDMKYRLRNRRK